MKLTKDHLIEGQIFRKGANLNIIKEETQAEEDARQEKAVMAKFKAGTLKTKDGKVVTDEGQAIAMSKAISKGDDN